MKEMEATVRIPNSTRRTSPLGLGLATLMREPSPRQQERLLHVAYEAGFRHFDVAPSYGLGSAERLLGRFLRSHRETVSVGTKVGIVARGNSGVARILQRPARALLRRFPTLRGRATQAMGGVAQSRGNFGIAACMRSLENSLRDLGTERVDILLLHDPQPSDVDDALIEWLQEQKERGTILNAGVAGTASSAASILRQHASSFDVAQVPSNVLVPSLGLLGEATVSLRVTHGVLSEPLSLIRLRLEKDPIWARALAERANADLTRPGALARLILAWAVVENRDGIVLVGASSAVHIRSASESLHDADRGHLTRVGEFLRSSLGA